LNNISLLPPEIKLYKQSRQKMMNYSFAFIIGLMVLLIIYFVLIFANVQANSELNKLKKDRATLDSEIQVLGKYEDLQQQVIFVNQTFEKIMNNVPDWDDLLVNIGLNIPDGVWLTDMTATQSKSKTKNEDEGEGEGKSTTGGDLLVRGLAINNSLIASWLDEIQKISHVQNANISFASKRVVDNQNVIQFEIKASITPGEYEIPFSKGVSQ